MTDDGPATGHVQLVTHDATGDQLVIHDDTDSRLATTTALARRVRNVADFTWGFWR